MKETLKLGGILLLITAVCAGLLGLVNSITAPLIAERKIENTKEAIQGLLPEADEVIQVEEVKNGGILEVYVAKKAGNYIGSVVKVAPNGYGGVIEMLVGVDASQQTTGIKLLAHTETPGLGANATHPSFTEQYKGRTGELYVVKTPEGKENEIVAITGSTITSQAVTKGVNEAVQYVVDNETMLMKEGN